MKLIGLSVAKAEAAPCGRHTKKWKLCAWRFFATRLLSVIALVPSNAMTLLALDMCMSASTAAKFGTTLAGSAITSRAVWKFLIVSSPRHGANMNVSALVPPGIGCLSFRISVTIPQLRGCWQRYYLRTAAQPLSLLLPLAKFGG